MAPVLLPYPLRPFMSDLKSSPARSRSSRARYREFVEDFRFRRLEDEPATETKAAADKPPRSRRQTFRKEYLPWLRPHVRGVVGVFVFAILVAALEMIEPLFMRFMVDRVLLNATLDTSSRLLHLNLAGGLFLAVVIASKLFGVLKDYRQKRLNVRVTLALRRALYERMLDLPLPKLWDMKTGGILSRLTGDVDLTTGLLQMAIVSPCLSSLRLIIAFGILIALNWRLALAAAVVVPGALFISFFSSKRVRPIYRVVRKDVERIDGRVGETFSGIRVVRAFGREKREFVDYLTGRHAVLRKELFAHRRELILWTSWGLLVAAVNVVIVWYGGYLNHTGRRLDRRHHGLPVVHVPADEPGVEHRQLLLRIAAVAGRDGAGVRCAGDGPGQAGPARRRGSRRRSSTRSASKTWSSNTARAGPWCAIST